MKPDEKMEDLVAALRSPASAVTTCRCAESATFKE
jgi:hypothetical protein